ncbi:MAG: isoprenylcysteine carboxylmethyltransferase family protein [Chloroflexi bacterium]|nr:isoprenylcysteine carboxylmethyltransferase family protein [Chloroflexota bacterium]MBI3741704.1 isoprenylcysteine carboxylmethyltransferase family protein [Chloroflexota bacterium]
MTVNRSDVAGVIAPPPLLFFVPLAIGVALNYFFPLTFLPRDLALILAAPFIAVGAILSGWAFRAFTRANTPPEPWEPTRALIVDGPFRFTRNPIYLAFTLIYIGVTFGFNAGWAAIFLPFVLFTLQRGMIAREEKYLEKKFGDAYRAYKARVRKWI